MKPVRAIALVTALVVIAVIAWGILGSGPDATEVAPPGGGTHTPRPTLTPLPTRTTPTPVPVLSQVTTAEELAGVWEYCTNIAGDCYTYQYDADGNYRGASIPSRDRLENAPSVTGEFWFEEGSLYLNVLEDTLTDVWSCIGDLGVYNVSLLESGSLTFELVQDSCAIRADDLPGFEHKPVELGE